MRISFLLLLIGSLTVSASLRGQSAHSPYADSLMTYRKNYIDSHEVVKGRDRQYLRFFPIDASYRVVCHLEPATDHSWLTMPTSGGERKIYRRYGRLDFTLHGKSLHLTIYQSQSLMQTEQYRDYLFVPFTDLSSGNTSYAGGRYLDYTLQDIHNGLLVLDFNKAYNPYCAYTTGYNCPIPPAENALPVAIDAGEKAYGKKITH